MSTTLTLLSRLQPREWHLYQFLVRHQIVQLEHLDVALKVQQQSQGPLDMILWQLGFIDLRELGELWDISHTPCEGCT